MGVYLAKPKTDKLSEEGGDLSQMLSAFGVASMQGWRQTMEDAHIAVPSLKCCCPGAVEALRALEQEQKKEEAERKSETQEKRKEVSSSSYSGTADEDKEQQSKRRPTDAKPEVAGQEISSNTIEQESSEQRTTQQSENQSADDDNNAHYTQAAAPEDISLYAVFDGHASNAVSCWVSDHYIKIFAECLQRVQQEAAQGHMPEGLAVGPPEAVSIFNLRNAAICEALQQSFLEVDEQMQKEDNRRALKKYYEEGQMEQKDDETYIQKYLNDGGDVRLVEMEGQKFLQFVPKTNEEDDESHKDSDDNEGEGSASLIARSTPVVEDLDAQEAQSATAAAKEQTAAGGQQQQEGDAHVKEGEKQEGKMHEEGETPSSVNGKGTQSGTDTPGSSSCGTGTPATTTEKPEPAGEKGKDSAADESSGSALSAARHITRFNSTADVTTLGDTVDATDTTSQPERMQQTAEEEKKPPEEEKKRTAEQAAGEDDVEMEDAQTSEEREDSTKRERRRRKEDSEEGRKTEKDSSDGSENQTRTAATAAASAAQKEEAGTSEKHTNEEEDGGGRADSGDDEDDDEDDDDVFGRREGNNGGERTPLFAHPSTPEGSGATAVVVLVVGGPEPVVVTANAGDSRGVICRGGKAFPLSHDHKPTNPDEKARIFAAGGSVTNGRVDGNLNLSRAVGDLFYKRNREVPAKAQRITAFPDVRITRVCEEDEFLILACDGIWDCKTNQEAVDFVRERLQRAGTSNTATLRRICEELCDDCLAEDPLQSEGHGCDNMTCLVVELSSHVRKHRPRAVKKDEKILLYGGGDDKYLGCEEKQFESDDNED